MASFLPSPDPGANITVTKEEFNLFHSIDRQLFTRLVVGLSRDTSQSTHVMAFIMWLEKKCKDFKIVANLLNWPDNLLNDLVDEAVMALNGMESSQFPYSRDKVLPLIHNISRGTMTLQYFHENRIEIIPAVTKYLNDVCTRAFTDIVQHVQCERAMKQQNYNVANYYGTMQNAFMPPVLYYAPAPRVAIVPQQIAVPVAQWHEGSSTPWVGNGSGTGTGADSYDASSRNDFNQEFKEILNKIQLSAATSASEVKQVPADDRTIFMTFSKGYPISESEVREFFARTYGDIIEAIHMQDVQPTEQPLFARMVVRPEAMNMIDSFLEGTGRVKFAINGKHVWARRYVRKGNKSPKAASPVTSGPPSPSAAETSH